MKKINVLLLFILTACCGYSQQAVTMGGLLREMIDASAVTYMPAPAYTLKQASSYDRHSVSPDKPGWFANADFNQFIREERKGDHDEYVMMDADGPGVIVRFWLTTVVKPGTIRFYFDGADTAAIVVPGFDLMLAGWKLGPGLLNPHSSYEPNGHGGNTLYLPLPYQKHCKVTWEFADSANRKTAHYYQINYRTYAAGTKVETYRPGLTDVYRGEIDKTEQELWNPVVEGGREVRFDKRVGAGEKVSFVLPSGEKMIKMLQANFDPVSDSLWRNVVIRIAFDGVTTVDCPVGDFIGSGEGGKKISSWYRSLSEDGAMASRWVMPYRRQAVVTLENRGYAPVGVKLAVRVAPYRWTSRSMYFHTTFKFERNVRDVKWDYDLNRVASKDKEGPIDWNFVRIRGGGMYMGNTLAVDNHMNAWYGEGDAKAWVDGETFPSEFGTGLEDYYNTSWAPVVLYQTPWANAPRADAPSSFGKNTFTRTRILDALPFTRQFAFDMEMLSWTGGFVDVGATTYWYGLPGTR